MSEISPYRGLIPYTEEDAAFFFGRETETEIVIANLLANRLTLLYGSSGVGKSSLLNAGVIYRLKQQAREEIAAGGMPEFIVLTFRAWRDSPLEGLAAAIRDAVEGLLGPQPDPDPAQALVEQVAQVTERHPLDLLIILDQFEEYFLYHPLEQEPTPFAQELARLINQAGLRVNLLLAMREDALAKLDRFKGRIPALFGNYLRLDHLDVEAGRAAIERPLGEYNRRHEAGAAVTIEPALVEAVLEQVRSGEVTLGEPGRGSIAARNAESHIETPYLQLVMLKLWVWETEGAEGSRLLRLATLQRLGGAQEIARTHLDTTLASLSEGEQATAAAFFYHLVTPSGSKIAFTAHDLAQYTARPVAELLPVLKRLTAPDLRILRENAPPPDQPQEPSYEIFHDVLATAILDWQRRWREAQAALLIRQEEKARADEERVEAEHRHTRQTAHLYRLLFVLSLVLVIASLVLASIAWRAQQQAERNETLAYEARATALAENEQLRRFQLNFLAERNDSGAKESRDEGVGGESGVVVPPTAPATATPPPTVVSGATPPPTVVSAVTPPPSTPLPPNATRSAVVPTATRDARRASPTASPTPPSTPTPDPSAGDEPDTPTPLPDSPGPPPTPPTPPTSDGMPLHYIPAGPFTQGATDSEVDRLVTTEDEKPQRTVTLSAFWMDETEITNDMFARFVAATDYRTDAEIAGNGWVGNANVAQNRGAYVAGAYWRQPQGADSTIEGMGGYPVTQVSWNDAMAYCTWAGRRLPTEAEWEKAARGSDGRLYPWGDEFYPPRGNYADRNFVLNYRDPEGDDGYALSAPVRAYPDGVSPYGLFDMAGNVWEWVADYYAEDTYRDEQAVNPTGPASGEFRILRGGSWNNNRYRLRTTERAWTTPFDQMDHLGFRCALSVE